VSDLVPRGPRPAPPVKKAPAKKAVKQVAGKKAAAKKAPGKKVPGKKVPGKKAAAKKAAAKKAPGKKAAGAKAPGGKRSNGPPPTMGLPELCSPSTDPRDLLGLGDGYTRADLRRAWRRFAARHHPDCGGDAAIFARGQWAYEHLSARLGTR
jgi:hypothetical protein